MPALARVMFGLMNFAARKGIRDPGAYDLSGAERKHAARATGVRGETFAYWYLRRHGYIIIARNYRLPGRKGEIDLIGYDGEILAFIEVKTRTTEGELERPPEDAVNFEKRRQISKMAQAFVKSLHSPREICRFDVLAIESHRGKPPEVRLRKNAFAGQR